MLPEWLRESETRALGREGVRGVCVYGSTCACVCTLYSMAQMGTLSFQYMHSASALDPILYKLLSCPIYTCRFMHLTYLIRATAKSTAPVVGPPQFQIRSLR